MDPIDLITTTDLLWSVAKRYVAKQKEIARTSRRKATQPTPGDEKLSHPPVVGRFVTCNRGFRRELESLKKTIEAHSRLPRAKRPLNILIGAPPGSGKSFLVKELANTTGSSVIFSEYQVAGFRSLEDLLDIFRAIQSQNLQAQLPFVLIDEVDTQVDGRYLFPNLLAPLWDGSYHIGATQYVLGRAVLFFAASTLLPPPTEEILPADDSQLDYDSYVAEWTKKTNEILRNATAPKIRDFVDRMDLLLCIPPLSDRITDGEPDKELRLLACALVTKHWPAITRVEKAAAWILINLLAEGGSRRRAESAVFRSLPPDGVAFDTSHLPENVRRRYASDEVVGKLTGSFFDLIP